MNLLDRLAYDTGGYTVQEILSSFCKKIIEIIDLVNKNEEVCDEAHTIIENIRNEVVPELVDDIMKEMQDSGYFDRLVNVTLIEQLRTELTTLLNQTITDYTTKLDNFDSQLETNTNVINSIAYVDVTRFSGINDNEKLRNAFSYIINLDNSVTKKLTTSKILNITEPIKLDFLGKKGYEIDLQITPNVIGSALTLTNAIGLKAKLDAIDGGNDNNTNNAFEIYNLHHCKLEVFGSYFKGTLLRVTGKEKDFSRCIGMEIKIRNYNCNRTLFHGDEVYPGAGFGCYTDVWEETWDASKPQGSIITGVHDVSCNHWESHFTTDKSDETNLNLVGVKSCYFGYLALGGKCKTLLNVGYESDVLINSLHLGSEDGNNVNGVKVGAKAELYCKYLKLVSVGDGVIINTDDSTTVLDVINCNSNVNRVIVYVGRDLGYSNTKKFSFTTLKTLPLARNVVICDTPTLEFTNGVATYKLNRSNKNVTHISGAFVMPFGSSEVFGIGISSEDETTTTFKIKCASNATYANNLQCRLTFLCENQI